MKNNDKHLVIDADSLLYIHAAVNEETTDWGDGVTSVIADLDGAIRGFTKAVQDIIESCECENYTLFFTGKTNFRYDVLPSYKSNRLSMEKPTLYDPLKEYATANFKHKITSKIEADDAVTILKSKNPKGVIIAAIDKDILCQSPGRHYNYKKQEWVRTTQRDATRFHYLQTLMGDTVDGYKGCPGIGKVKANDILQAADDYLEEHPAESPDAVYWRYVVKAYESKKLTEADALIQARVAFMLTKDYWVNNEVILWNPTKEASNGE